MADESLNFKFSLDLSDFDKAPQIIDDALKTIARKAEAQGKNADVAMAEYLQDFIKEREAKVQALGKQIEEATRAFAEMDANFKNGNASFEDWKKSLDTLDDLKDKLWQTKDQLQLLKEKEDEVTGNMSFMDAMKLRARDIDLYGKVMSMLPAPIANVIQSTKGLNKALLALTTNPVVMMLAGLALAIKGLYGWFDGLADRSDGVAYAFGVVTGAVDKAISAFNELIHLNVEGFLYNIKTMFDGGEREVAKRNEDLRRVEEQGLRERLQRDNQFLRRRMSNTKLDMKDRLDAEQQYTENLKKIEETRRAELERKMTEWSKQHGLRTKDNPEGWATDISQLSGPLQVELQEMYNEMARIDNAMDDITEESKDRLVKMHEQQMELMKERLRYNRQVREQMEAEKERLRSLASQTENMAIQAQINDMADGIDKITKQAQLKSKQAFEALEQTLRNEAQQLYNNEKSIFEGDPNNNGKIFKAFNLNDYIEQAKENIGYKTRKGLISNEEIKDIKKGTDEIVKNALDGAKKVAGEIDDVINRINDLSNADLPAVFGGEISLGFKEYIRDLERVDQLNAQAQQVTEELINLEKERLTLEQKLTIAQTNDEKERISNRIKANTEATTKALDRAKKTEEDLKLATSNVNESYGKVLNTVGMIEETIGECANQFKGLSKEGDEFIEALQEMLSIVGKLASGDYIGAIVQVIVLAVKTTANYFKTIKENRRNAEEWGKKMTSIYQDATEALYAYRQAMIDAKYAQDDLWSNTNIGSMIKYYEKEQQALADFTKSQDDLYKRTTERNGVVVGSKLYYQLLDQGAKFSKFRNDNGVQRTDMKTDNWYDALTVGYQDWRNQGELLKTVLAQRGMAQLYDEIGNFNLEAYNELKDTSDLWEGLGEQAQKDIELVAKSAEKYREYKEELQKAMADWFSPLLDNVTDAMMDWLTDYEDVMDKAKEYSSDTFRQIVKDMIKNMLYKDIFAGFKTKIEDMTKEYLNTGNEQNYAQAIASVTNTLMNDLNDSKEKAKTIWDTWGDAMKNIGIDMSETVSGRSAEARGIARASQESVDENNARLAMMQQHTYSINANISQLLQTSSQMLLHLQGIHTNTNELMRLERIEKSLANIETYGVRTR